MAKSTPTTKTKAERPAKTDDDVVITPESILAAEMSANKGDHLNYEDEIYYKVSTGSLNMDIEMGGGVNPGVFVVSGEFETGKSSFTLACMKNMLDTVPNSRGFYVKAEGRLSPEMRERSGIKFVFGKWITNEAGKKVFDVSDWKDGTCFVSETNVWEFTLNNLRRFVAENDSKKRYFFFIDSMDAMSLRDDIAKEVGTANRVAGGPLLTKQFLQKMANAMAKRGHICALAGQVSAAIQLDPYTPAQRRSGPGGGGNAKDHWGNFIFVFKGKTQKDFILEKPSEKPDRITNAILGHNVNVLFKKTPNEKSNITVSYPVKYGRKDGKSVWVEYEIVDALLMFQLLVKPPKGSWLNLSENLQAELKENNLNDVPEQLQGIDNWRKFLEERQDVTEYLFAKFKKLIGQTKTEG